MLLTKRSSTFNLCVLRRIAKTLALLKYENEVFNNFNCSEISCRQEVYPVEIALHMF